MDASGKQSSVANVAIAGELACWAVGRMAEGHSGRAADIAWSFPEPPSSTSVGPIRGFFCAAAKPPRTPKDRRTDTEGPAAATRCTGTSCAMGEFKRPWPFIAY